jgi:hypothetical protein
MTLNITIAGTAYPIVLHTEVEQLDIDVLGLNFDNEEHAEEAWGNFVNDWDGQILKVKLAKRTPAVWLVVSSTIGWWMSKEFLLATGNGGDAKLVKEEKYVMPYTEFISKCSKFVRLECQNHLAKILEAKLKVEKKEENNTNVTTQKQPKKAVTEQEPNTNRLFPTQKKSYAVSFMLEELKADGTGTYVINPPWLVNFIQGPVKQTTAENLVMEISKNTLFISFKREFYMNNREGCQKALEVIKTSCRGTKLEYGKMVSGRLPIKVRGTWTSTEI